LHPEALDLALGDQRQLAATGRCFVTGSDRHDQEKE
jgi:hypothetical protein